jgi:hypothetical protein
MVYPWLNLNPMPLPTVFFDQRQFFEYAVTAQDPDGNPVTIVPLNLPNDSVFQSNQFSWIPGTGQTGSHEVTFIASDGSLQNHLTVVIDIFPASTTSGAYFVF